MILGITGHRPPKLGGYRIPNPVHRAVCGGLTDWIRRYNPDRVLTGMALGTDQWAAEVCLELGIPFVAVLPFHGFSSKWPEESRRHFDWLCNQAESLRVISDTHEYRSGLLMRRNEWIVRNSDSMLAVFTGGQGGTAATVRYAQNVGKSVTVVQLPDHIVEEARRIEEGYESRRSARQPSPYLTNILYPPRPAPAPIPIHDYVDARTLNEGTIAADIARAADYSLLAAMYPTIPQNVAPAPQVSAPTETPTSPEPQKEQTRALAGFKPGRLIDLDE